MHDHAIALYDSEEGLVRSLGSFLAEGLFTNGLMLFIHGFESGAEAARIVELAQPGANLLARRRVLLVSYYSDAFERRGKIDYAHVEGVVEDTLARARANAKERVLLFVDASHVYFAESRASEWFEFERWLGKRLQPAIALVCAYRRKDVMAPEVVAEVLRTHLYRFDEDNE